jgi:two-component system CheB/CheR fusion protein
MTDQTNSKRKILFVDDDKFLLDMYALKFTKAGFNVKACDGTDVALKVITEGFAPEIILADIVMPGMDGLDFVEKIRSDKLATDAVVIMLTNQGSSEDIAKAQRVKVDGYIIKATTIPSEVLVEVEKIYAQKIKI